MHAMAAPSIAASYASDKAFDREVAAVRDFGARFALTFQASPCRMKMPDGLLTADKASIETIRRQRRPDGVQHELVFQGSRRSSGVAPVGCRTKSRTAGGPAQLVLAHAWEAGIPAFPAIDLPPAPVLAVARGRGGTLDRSDRVRKQHENKQDGGNDRREGLARSTHICTATQPQNNGLGRRRALL